MKKKYEYIAWCLLKFSAELDYHEEESRDQFFLSIKHDDFRRNLLAELEQALNDPELSWIDFLYDNDFCIFGSDDEQETRDFIREYFYDPAMAVEQEVLRRQEQGKAGQD